MQNILLSYIVFLYSDLRRASLCGDQIQPDPVGSQSPALDPLWDHHILSGMGNLASDPGNPTA